MKKIILLLSLLSLSFTTIQDPYCNGWEQGYCQGWQYVKGEWSICPITPICPIPKLMETKFLDGYNRGFVKGRKDAKKQ
jgi:hypothetical protein